MKILALETTSQAGSVAILEDGEVVHQTALPTDDRSAKSLAPAVQKILAIAGWQSKDVRLIAVATGPGSFTGLRVGVTTAKTLAYIVRAEVIGVNSLEVIAAQAPAEVERLSAVLDAQRQQVFVGEFIRDAVLASARHFTWIGGTSIQDNDAWLSSLEPSITVSGSSLDKLAPRLPANIVAVPPDFWAPRAATVGRLGWRLHQAGQRDDLWRLVPQYFRRSAAEEKWRGRTLPVAELTPWPTLPASVIGAVDIINPTLAASATGRSAMRQQTAARQYEQLDLKQPPERLSDPRPPTPRPLPPVSSSRKWLLLTLKLAVLGLLVWGIRHTLGDAFDKLREQPLHLDPLWLVVSGTLYLLAMLPSVLFWQRVLHVLGQDVGLLKTARAYYIGHLGKYVPGKALVVVLRAGMVRGERVHVGVAAASVFVETLTMMASGSFIAAALVAILYREHWVYVAGSVVCMIAAGLPTLPPVFAYLVRVTRLGRGATEAGVDLRRIDYGTLLFGWLGTGIGWFISGLSLWALLRGMGEASLGPLDGLPFLTMIVSISVVAGFISMIPGGLGSRDLVMLELLSLRPETKPLALAAIVILRLVWLAAELAISALLYPCRTKH